MHRPTGAVTVTEGGTLLATKDVPASGDLRLTLPVLSPGTHDLVVRTAASASVTATEHTVRLTVAGEPAKGSDTPDADLTGSTTTLTPGAEITLVARGFLPGEVVAYYLHSDPIFLGTAVADAEGVATLTVALPAGAAPGAHHVQATGGTSGRWAEIPVTVTSATGAVAEPVATAPVVAAPAAAAAPLAATGAELGSTVLLISVLLGSGAVLLVGRRRIGAAAR